MLDERIKKLIEHIAEDSQCESGWLYPDPQWYVFSIPILDAISEIYGVPKKEIADIFNPVRERIEAKTKKSTKKSVGPSEAGRKLIEKHNKK